VSDLNWQGFAIAVLLLEITPGPNMAWLAGISMADGRKAGFSATAGIALGLAINGICAAIGLSSLILADARIWMAIHWGGAALMAWLAWQAWQNSNSVDDAPAIWRQTLTRYFLSGVGINILNPKAFLFYILLAPPFLGGRLPNLKQALILSAISTAVATLVHIIVTLGAAQAHGWANSGNRTRMVQRLLAVLLLGVAIWFAMQSSNPG
jgi:threonine/homoserine/homoserine lactone efflux protein